MGTYPGGSKAMLQHERDTWGPGTQRGPGEDGSCGGPEAVGTRRGCDGAASRGGGTASWLLRARGRPGDTRGTQTGAARCGTAASKHRSGGAGVSGGVPEETGMDRRGSGGDRGGPTCSRGQRQQRGQQPPPAPQRAHRSRIIRPSAPRGRGWSGAERSGAEGPPPPPAQRCTAPSPSAAPPLPPPPFSPLPRRLRMRRCSGAAPGGNGVPHF